MILAGWMTVALCAFAVAALTGGRWRLIREMRPFAGSALFAAIVLPWFLLVQLRLPDFLRYFILDQHVARFLSGEAEHAKPFWFFLPVVLFGFFPWIAHLPVGRRPRPDGPGRIADPGRIEPVVLFAWIWFGMIALFFTVSTGKIVPYVLPAYPPLALLVASRLGRMEKDPRLIRGVRSRSIAVGAPMLAAAPVFWFGIRWFMARDRRLEFQEVERWSSPLVGAYAIGGVVILALAIRRRPAGALAAQAGFQVVFFLLLLGSARATDPYLSPRVLGESLASKVGPDDLVLLYRVRQPSLEYYLGRPPTFVAWSGEYAYGMSLRPDPKLFIPDGAKVRQLLSSERTVYVVAKREDPTVPEAFGAPVEFVAGNRKRSIYRNLPQRAGR